jgi:hypothetical protein
VEQFGPNGKPLEKFVANGCVLCDLQLRRIMPICALLQRMGIFSAERENIPAHLGGVDDFPADEMVCTRNVNRQIFSIN